ncbi:MAG TPA: hypothetical protein VM658_09325 [bacterium]|nr:hypothetical protein [bacterium]
MKRARKLMAALCALIFLLLPPALSRTGEPDVRGAAPACGYEQAEHSAADSARAEAKAQAALQNAQKVLAMANASNSPDAAKARDIAQQAVDRAQQALELSRARSGQDADLRDAAGRCQACAQGKVLTDKLSDLHGQVAATQDQLIKLSRSVQNNTAALEAWAAQSDQAAQGALTAATDLLKQSLLDGLVEKLEADRKILAGQISETERSYIDAKLKGAPATELIMQEKQKMLRDQAVIDSVLEANKVVGRAANISDILTRETALEKAYAELSMALNEPVVQKALSIGKTVGGIAKYAPSVVDYAYNATSWACSYNRVNQMDKVSDDYLAAMRSLSNRMKKLNARIAVTRTDLAKAQARCAAK